MMSADVPRFAWRTYAPHGEAFHFARAVKSEAAPTRLHRHRGFAEVCWVEAGAGWHRLNGARQPLSAGDVLCIRTADVHGLEAQPGGTLTIVNVAFPAATLAHLRARYFPGETRWFWSPRRHPAPSRLNPAALARLGQAARELAAAPRTPAPLARGLLNLFFELAEVERDGRPAAALPDWLAAACERIRQPDHFRQGVGQLFALAGRSPEHVARTVRRCLRLTPSDLLNQVRLDHAALQLQVTHAPVTEIAFACGYENLSHFFHRFRRRFRLSPGAYRRARRQDIV
jgi:AraC family cel operon transcriptional repressor